MRQIKRDSDMNIYVLDTNEVVINPNIVDLLGKNVIVMSYWLLEELDKLKRKYPHLARDIREATRNLEIYRKKGVAEGLSLYDGIPTAAGGVLVFDQNANDLTEFGFPVEDNVDNRIILVAKHWRDQEAREAAKAGEDPRKVVLMSEDFNVRLRASSIDVLAEEWKRDQLVTDPEDIYSGRTSVSIKPEHAGFLSTLHRDKRLLVSEFPGEYDFSGLLPNQCVTLVVEGAETTALAIYKKQAGAFELVKKSTGKGRNWQTDIRPINDEQEFAYSLLTDESISIVSMTGVAGTGKTLMALKAGLKQVKAGKYDRILVWKSTAVVGEGLGFYKGSIKEKFAPFARPVYRAFAKVLGDSEFSMKTIYEDEDGAFASEYLSVEPILHVKGSTEDRVFLIIDEPQDFTPAHIRALITRAGLGTKVVLAGDVKQIEHKLLNELNNGLTYAVECWRGSEMSGHVSLVHPERSPLVAEAARLMR